MDDNSKYVIEWSDYSFRHYKKPTFIKKYKSQWGPTEASINEQLSRLPSVVTPGIHGRLNSDSKGFLVKIDFAVAGTNMSGRASGNRAIACGNYETKTITVLLVYHKRNVVGHDETLWWKLQIKQAFPYIGNLYC